MSNATRPCLLVALLALAGLAAAWPATAAAQVHRCVQPDGRVIYTDRPCADFGAIERAAQHGSGNDRRNRVYHGGCARSLQDLSFEMSMAIDTHDVNRLASVYHWVGMSTGSATAVMRRLNALVHRPLVNIMPVLSAPRPVRRNSHSQRGDLQTDVDRGRPRVSALRVVQTLDDGHTPSRAVFDLHQYFGCLWIRG